MKYYFIDNGLLGIFLTDANTSLLENIVAIHLFKQYGDKVYFYNQNIELVILCMTKLPINAKWTD